MAESIRKQDRELKAKEEAEQKEKEEKKKETSSLSEEERRVAEKAADKKVDKEEAKKEVAKEEIKEKTGHSAEAFAEVARTVLETKDSYDHATIGQTADSMAKVKGNNVESMLESMAKDPELAKNIVRAGLGSKFTSTNEAGVQEGSRTVLEKNREVGGVAGMEEALSQAALYGQGLTAAEIREMKMDPETLKRKVEELKANSPKLPSEAEKEAEAQKKQNQTPEEQKKEEKEEKEKENSPERTKAIHDWMVSSR